MSLVVQRSDVSEFRRRFRWIGLAMALLFIGIIGRMFQLQILESDENKAIARETSSVVSRSRRRAGSSAIAWARSSRRAGLRTTSTSSRSGSTCRPSGPISSIISASAWTSARGSRGFSTPFARARPERLRKSHQILLKEDISRDAVATLATHDRGAAGGQRRDRAGALLPLRRGRRARARLHGRGRRREPPARSAARDLPRAIAIGAMGIERAWRATCAARAVGRRSLVDANGRNGAQAARESSRSRGASIRSRAATPPDARRRAQRAMRQAMRGAARGRRRRHRRAYRAHPRASTRSRASTRTSSPAARGRQVIRDAFRRLYSDPLKPALDKTISGAYPPGSTFKPFTALAALEKGLIDPRSTTQCRRRAHLRQAHLPLHPRARRRSICTRRSRSRATSTSTRSRPSTASAWTASREIGPALSGSARRRASA